MLGLYMLVILPALGYATSIDFKCNGELRLDGRCGPSFTNSSCPLGLCCNKDGYCSQSCPSGVLCPVWPASCQQLPRLDLRCGSLFGNASCPQGQCCSDQGKCTNSCSITSICPPPRVCQSPPRPDFLCGYQHDRASCPPGFSCEYDGRCRTTCSDEALCPQNQAKELNPCGRRPRHDLRCGTEFRRSGCNSGYCCDHDNVCKKSCSVYAVCHLYQSTPSWRNMTISTDNSPMSSRTIQKCPVKSSHFQLSGSKLSSVETTKSSLSDKFSSKELWTNMAPFTLTTPKVSFSQSMKMQRSSLEVESATPQSSSASKTFPSTPASEIQAVTFSSSSHFGTTQSPSVNAPPDSRTVPSPTSSIAAPFIPNSSSTKVPTIPSLVLSKSSANPSPVSTKASIPSSLVSTKGSTLSAGLLSTATFSTDVSLTPAKITSSKPSVSTTAAPIKISSISMTRPSLNNASISTPPKPLPTSPQVLPSKPPSTSLPASFLKVSISTPALPAKEISTSSKKKSVDPTSTRISSNSPTSKSASESAPVPSKSASVQPPVSTQVRAPSTKQSPQSSQVSSEKPTSLSTQPASTRSAGGSSKISSAMPSQITSSVSSKARILTPLSSSPPKCPSPAQMNTFQIPPRTKCIVGGRRNIESLSDEELTAYRDAVRLNYRCGNYNCPWLGGPFMKLAHDHDCTWDRSSINGWVCPHGNPQFLPWHRRYLLRMETLLCNAIPYWDFSATSPSPIPKAFTDLTYISNGTTYPNPLYNGFLSDGSPTTRSPTANLLNDIQTKIALSRGQTTFSDFTSTLEDAHNQAHCSVGGSMFFVTTAAYDPMFWSLHMFVDYTWYKWQVLHPKAIYPAEATGQIVDGDGPFLGSEMIARTSDWERLAVASTFSTQSGFKMVSGRLEIIVTITNVPMTATPCSVNLMFSRKILASSMNLASGASVTVSGFRNATLVVTSAYQSLVDAGQDPEVIESSVEARLLNLSTNITIPINGEIIWQWLTVFQ